MKRYPIVLALAVAAAAAGAFGQEAGEGSGRYATHNMSVESTDLPDGGHVEISHYHQAVFADTPGFPLDGTSADCVGMTLFNKDDAVTSASGSCYVKDGAGSGASMWWRMDEAGTSECPIMCGTWGYFDGYGSFKGISGGGTWSQTTLFPDGSIGTWEGSYLMK